jgi:hypothetical protein
VPRLSHKERASSSRMQTLPPQIHILPRPRSQHIGYQTPVQDPTQKCLLRMYASIKNWPEQYSSTAVWEVILPSHEGSPPTHRILPFPRWHLPTRDGKAPRTHLDNGKRIRALVSIFRGHQEIISSRHIGCYYGLFVKGRLSFMVLYRVIFLLLTVIYI